MRTIWKFRLHEVDRQHVAMPRDARLLCLQAQGGELALWAEVDTTAPTRLRLFEIHGTGNPIPAAPRGTTRVYVGTAQLPPFVWHLYELADVAAPDQAYDDVPSFGAVS